MTYSNYKTIVLCTICTILISGCNIINPTENIPSYIYIESIAVDVTDPIAEGTSSSNIKDAWVFVDDQIEGVYELPATIPILSSGDHTLKVLGGIWLSGSSVDRVAYPFYDFFMNDTTFTLIPDSIITVAPIVKYYDDLTFLWKEDFENAGMSIDSVGGPKIKKTEIEAEVFEGTTSGIIELDAFYSDFKLVSEEGFDLPKEGRDIFLEFDYQTDVTLIMGLILDNAGALSEHSIAGINPTGEKGWTKMYIDLTPVVSGFTSADTYQIYFEGSLGTEDGLSDGRILFDNFKLVHAAAQ